MLYKIINNLMPDYISEPIPNINQSYYNLRIEPVFGRIGARTDKYKARFFLDSLLEWSKCDPETKQSPSIDIFKSRQLSLIRPPSNSTFGIYDLQGLALLTQLRVGMRKLNYHKFRLNFRESINPMCPINDGMEDVEQYLLLCHSFCVQRYDFLASVLPVLCSFDLIDAPCPFLLQILLYGDKNLPFEVNKFILQAIVMYILRTECLT